MTVRTTTALTMLAIGILGAVWTSEGSAQRPIAPQVISSLSGADLYRFYCASCHGIAGKGDGPVTGSLKTAPPDLTTIASRHDGHFPNDTLVRFVAGEDRVAPAHGSPEMPVWGPIFQSLEPHDRLTRIRIENVVKFIESLQKP